VGPPAQPPGHLVLIIKCRACSAQQQELNGTQLVCQQRALPFHRRRRCCCCCRHPSVVYLLPLLTRDSFLPWWTSATLVPWAALPSSGSATRAPSLQVRLQPELQATCSLQIWQPGLYRAALMLLAAASSSQDCHAYDHVLCLLNGAVLLLVILAVAGGRA